MTRPSPEGCGIPQALRESLSSCNPKIGAWSRSQCCPGHAMPLLLRHSVQHVAIALATAIAQVGVGLDGREMLSSRTSRESSPRNFPAPSEPPIDLAPRSEPDQAVPTCPHLRSILEAERCHVHEYWSPFSRPRPSHNVETALSLAEVKQLWIQPSESLTPDPENPAPRINGASSPALAQTLARTNIGFAGTPSVGSNGAGVCSAEFPKNRCCMHLLYLRSGIRRELE
ncbi:hypothetical protein V496_02561 [Pseudogymnoascus sp. VKM F-4515 (FW-2607)]|nr:hypothetical protein V496_02561 [Pseudogymnoascus sp. VKM F-4515 (FW-2607)]